MKYSEAQEKLLQAFKDLAVAKQEFIMLGGTLNFEAHRGTLKLEIIDGSTASFPFTVDGAAVKKFKEQNPQHEYKS